MQASPSFLRPLHQFRRSSLLALLLLALLAGACGGDDAAPVGEPTAAPPASSPANGTSAPTPALAPADRAFVAVSFAVLADIVANVGGDRIEVWSVTPPNADPHTYEASPQDLARLSDADYLVMVGGRFEAFAERTAWRRAARDAGVETLYVVDAIDAPERDMVIDHGDHTHDYSGGDPHFWLDPQQVLKLLPAVADALAVVDPEGAEYFAENAQRYADEVAQVDAEFEAAVAQIPPERRVLIVHHDAFGYLVDRFGFIVLAVVPSSGGGEASAGNVAELHREIQATGVPAVFREPQFQSSILDGLARDHGIAVGVLMTDAFTDEVRTYLDLIRFNIDSLVTHLD